MKQKQWWVLLSVVSVLLMFCAVRAVKRTVTSAGAHSIKVCEGRAQSDENDIDARLEKATETVAANSLDASKEAQLRQQEAEQLRTLDDQLRSLDKDITQKRQKVETWYAQNLAHLRRWAEQRNRDLDNAERAAYAQCMQQMRNTSSVTQRDLSANGQTYSSGYLSPYGQLYGSSSTTVRGRSFETTNTYVVGDPAAQYQATLIEIRQARQAARQEFVRLAQRKKEELANLDAEQERKKTSLIRAKYWKERGYRFDPNHVTAYGMDQKVKEIERAEHWKEREAARRLSGDQTPTVEAIITTANNRFCALIGDALVSEGNTVKGYRVQKICADSVEFEKDGKVWVQKVH